MSKTSKVYSEPSRMSRMEHFAKIVNDWISLIIFTKSFVLDVRPGSEYASEILRKNLHQNTAYFLLIRRFYQINLQTTKKHVSVLKRWPDANANVINPIRTCIILSPSKTCFIIFLPTALKLLQKAYLTSFYIN